MRVALLAASVSLALASTAEARTHHHYRHHHYAHHHHAIHAHSFAEGLGAGLAHMLGSIKKVETEAGPIRVAAAYADRFVGFINALVEEGYKPKDIGCYSPTGHMPGSKHHVGMACDIDQTDRNRTAGFMYHVTELAHKFNLTDGCEWSNKDCGHIQVPDADVPMRNRYAHHRRIHYAHHYHRRYARMS